MGVGLQSFWRNENASEWRPAQDALIHDQAMLECTRRNGDDYVVCRCRHACTTTSGASGATQRDCGDEVNPHGEQNETAEEVNAKAMAYSVSPEMYICVCDSDSDIDPGQRLHGDAANPGDHGRQADDVEKHRRFKQIGEMASRFGTQLGFHATLVDSEIVQRYLALTNRKDAGPKQCDENYGGEYDHREHRVDHAKFLFNGGILTIDA
jgi:hypothetical protein